MISLIDFKKYNLSINWKVIDIGWKDYFLFKKQLTAKEILDYALSKIETGDEEVLKLASCNPNEEEEISNLVSTLAFKDKADFFIALEKWKVLYVIKNLPSKEIDFLDGLLKLGEIWIDLDFPKDCPYIFQGKENTISPKDYYTYENYIYFYEKHIEWINKKLAYLISQE